MGRTPSPLMQGFLVWAFSIFKALVTCLHRASSRGRRGCLGAEQSSPLRYRCQVCRSTRTRPLRRGCYQFCESIDWKGGLPHQLGQSCPCGTGRGTIDGDIYVYDCRHVGRLRSKLSETMVPRRTGNRGSRTEGTWPNRVDEFEQFLVRRSQR